MPPSSPPPIKKTHRRRPRCVIVPAQVSEQPLPFVLARFPRVTHHLVRSVKPAAYNLNLSVNAIKEFQKGLNHLRQPTVHNDIRLIRSTAKMTAAGSDSGSDATVDHFADDASNIGRVAIAAPGYDNHNGYRSHTYVPQPPQGVAASKVDSAAPSPRVIYVEKEPQYPAYPYIQYNYALTPGYVVPAPALYQYGPIGPQPMLQAPQPAADYHVYQPQHAAPALAPAQPTLWLGRTKAQVEEDNMKLAAKEGAYEKRKVAPTGVKDDQMCWCVETDGSNTLRYVHFCV
jgi:hypothetical protein